VRLVTGNGEHVEVGRELGRGGEGTVYEVAGRSQSVAKLYHRALSGDKQAKLQFMVANASDALYAFSTWPQATLHQSRGGTVVGLLMDRVTDCVPVHSLYSPAQRRQAFPQIGWGFLLLAARNTAAAFSALHEHGHVVGDVNQGNVLVHKRDARVVLIDSDSFQVRTNTALHRCEVGVPHFTPPELQDSDGFTSLDRTPQHDAFGLALLIFHLLFGGRHPYSGVPLIQAAGNVLEDDIQSLRYAYARDAAHRGFAPPPKSIPISLLPVNIEGMFHYAFTELGRSGQRPTAKQWVAALDATRESLLRCSQCPTHDYPKHLPICPWCDLAKAGIIYFVSPTTPTSRAGAFSLDQVWAQINAVRPPLTPSKSVVPTSAKPRPLPAKCNRDVEIYCYRAIGLAVMIAGFIAAPAFGLAWGLAAVIGWISVGGIGSADREAERKKRQAEVRDAESGLSALQAQARAACDRKHFDSRKQELLTLCNEYTSLPSLEAKEIDSLRVTAHARQLHAFLDQQYIETAAIPGVGPAKKAALRSFGIETAADVEWRRVQTVKGFGDVLTKAMVDWRRSHEQRFRFDPSRAVTAADRDGVRNKFAARRQTVQQLLGGGAASLQAIVNQSEAHRLRIEENIAAAAERLSQARADMTVFGGP
jgi:DNA-binding helix-hairpin-helix protein with protein kinase domain